MKSISSDVSYRRYEKLQILKYINKIPGGLMLIPMAIAAIINTVCPEILKIGNPTTAIFSSSGTMTIIGIMLVFTGIQFKSNQLILTLKRGGILVVAKVLISILFGIIIMASFGQDGILGVSTLALVVCIASCNPGIYIALMESYGDEIDIANFALLNLIGLPFIPICILGFAGGYGIDYISIIATLIPFFIGVLLGNIDPEIRNFTKQGMAVMIPFLGFCLGSSINLINAFSEVGLGLVLFVIYLIVNNIPMLALDKFILKQKGYASMAICCVAGLSVAVPSLMAEVDSSYMKYVDSATAQIAFVVIISTIFTPIIVKKLSK